MTWCNYKFLLDGENYEAIFLDTFEAHDFIKDVQNDGSEIILKSFKVLYFEDMINLLNNPTDLICGDYVIELIGEKVLPNYRDFPKTWMVENELKRLGWL